MLTILVLQSELKTAMRLLGAQMVQDLGPTLVCHDIIAFSECNDHAYQTRQVNTRIIEQQLYDGPPGLEKFEMWVSSKL